MIVSFSSYHITPSLQILQKVDYHRFPPLTVKYKISILNAPRSIKSVQIMNIQSSSKKIYLNVRWKARNRHEMNLTLCLASNTKTKLSFVLIIFLTLIKRKPVLWCLITHKIRSVNGRVGHVGICLGYLNLVTVSSAC